MIRVRYQPGAEFYLIYHWIGQTFNSISHEDRHNMPEIFFADSFIYSSNLQFISAESSNIRSYVECNWDSIYFVVREWKKGIFDDSAEINCKFDE